MHHPTDRAIVTYHSLCYTSRGALASLLQEMTFRLSVAKPYKLKIHLTLTFNKNKQLFYIYISVIVLYNVNKMKHFLSSFHPVKML